MVVTQPSTSHHLVCVQCGSNGLLGVQTDVMQCRLATSLSLPFSIEVRMDASIYFVMLNQRLVSSVLVGLSPRIFSAFAERAPPTVLQRQHPEQVVCLQDCLYKQFSYSDGALKSISVH